MTRWALRYVGHRPGASLHYFTGASVTQQSGDVFEIPLTGATIGRRGSADLRLASSMVGGAHAKLTITNDQLIIVDLRSTNGTRVNDEPLAIVPRVLIAGDRITLGNGFDFEVIERV